MFLTDRFQQALMLATELHAEQLRKGTRIPYVSHLLGVCGLALEYGANEDEAIAALLHDAVEDQGGPPTLELIRRQFGDNVAMIVDGCTDADTYPKPPWRVRKETYIAHLATAPRSVLLVSACDKLHNVRTILCDYNNVGDNIWYRFKAGKEGSLWYYRSLVNAFRARPESNTALINELDRTVTDLEEVVSR